MAQGWTPLSQGSVVDVVAPAMMPSREAIKGAARVLKEWGLIPRIPRDLLGRDPVCANSDEKRFEFLKNAIEAKDSSVIWCLRGGYGSIRLLPYLAKMRKPSRSKLIVGLSDITSLHLFVGQRWGWSSLHASHLDRIGQGLAVPSVVRETRNVLSGKQTEVVFNGLRAMNGLAESAKAIKAPVTGGNLITVQSTIGTPFQIDTRGRILFLEEIGERGYRVDRVLEHLEQAGLFRGVKAVVFGQFTGGAEANGRKLWRPVLERFAAHAPFPVLKGLASGHDRVQRPVPFHTLSQLHFNTGQLISPTGVRVYS